MFTNFFFSMAERWGFSKKLYSVPDINCRSVKIQHIKRIVKDIHVFASSFDITDIVENEKKIQSLVFVFFFYRVDLPAVAET